MSKARGPWFVLALIVSAMTGCGASGPASHSPVHSSFGVVVRIGGQQRTLRLAGPTSVATVLAKLQLAPHRGQLLSAVSHRFLAPVQPVRITVSGRPASLGTRLAGTAMVQIDETTDQLEPTVSTLAPAGPDPAAVDLMRVLYTPGHRGAQTTVRGAFSGEVVSDQAAAGLVGPSPRSDKVVSLTFDDGPGDYTARTLQVLRDKGVKGTFCVIGRQAVQSPYLLRQLVADGHVLCDHTQDHDIYLDRRSASVVDAQISTGSDSITAAAGGAVPRFYRPPGGALSPGVITTAKQHGLQVLMWSVDTEDWRRPGVDRIVARATVGVPNGAIILLHDGGGDRSQTVAALPTIIDRLRAQGFTIVQPETTVTSPTTNSSPRT